MTRPEAGRSPPTLRIGDWSVRPLSDGTFRLDGGAMFGVVPKRLWCRHARADADNTVPLALRPFLVEGNGRRIVIEAGIGTRWEEKRLRLYRIEHPPTLPESLASLGIEPESVDTLVLSHFHFDHAGGAVRWNEGGEPIPTFPRASVVVSRAEIEAAAGKHARSASYRVEDLEPLARAGRLRPVEERAEVAPGIAVHVLRGHSHGSSVVTIDGGGRRAIFWDDVVPTSAHVQPLWMMAFDLFPEDSLRVREAWIGRAADEGWIGLLYHDPDHAWGRIVRDEGRFSFRPLVSGDLAG